MSGSKYKFSPHKDITAYEVALLIEADWKFQMTTESFVDSFPENVQRHFEKIEN